MRRPIGECGRDAVAAAVPVLVGVAYTAGFFWWRTALPPTPLSMDVYDAHYPNAVYAARALARGWGLLWIGVQNCGQPFLPSTLLGPFYPLHWLLLAFADPNPAFLLNATIHVVVGTVAVYGLCRAAGAGRAGAIVGALTFELCSSTVGVAGWVPTSILGPFVWMPAAWWALERLLARPGLRRAAVLAAILGLQLLGGYPQIVLFTYQVLGLRLAAALVVAPAGTRARRFGWAALALALPPALAAVYLLPATEFAYHSVRHRTLSPSEFAPQPPQWQRFRRDMRGGTLQLVPPYTVVGFLLAGPALVGARRRAAAWFWFAIAALYLALPWETPLREAYRALPFGATFREPIRFVWVSTTAYAVVVACGVDAILRAATTPPRRRLAVGVAAVAGLAAFAIVSSRMPSSWELAATAATVAVVAFAVARPGRASLAAPALVTLAGGVLLGLAWNPFVHFAPDGAFLHRRAAAYDLLRSRMTPQDRFLGVGIHGDYSHDEKTATLVDLPSIDDYEPQTSQRYAELLVYLFGRARMDSMNPYVYRAVVVPQARRLLDLLAARYLVWDPDTHLDAAAVDGLVEVGRAAGLVVYENPRARPRAFFVSRLEVLPDGFATLERLDDPAHDPTAVAFVEEQPADGFLGTAGTRGTVTIVQDRAETLTLGVDASGPGFAFVSDQLYPGWRATVNGVDVPILRANHAFRAVRVPAGRSTVVMTYRPRSLAVGAAISAATALGLAGALWAGRRTTSAPPGSTAVSSRARRPSSLA